MLTREQQCSIIGHLQVVVNLIWLYFEASNNELYYLPRTLRSVSRLRPHAYYSALKKIKTKSFVVYCTELTELLARGCTRKKTKLTVSGLKTKLLKSKPFYLSSLLLVVHDQIES